MDDQNPFMITKASGEQVVFSDQKLLQSLLNAGAGQQLSEEILQEVKTLITPGCTTGKIYQKAFQLLRKKSRPSAARYKLKRAVMELGPSGYPFERFVGEILSFQGYQVEVGIVMKGKCITHEVDVLAEKDQTRIAAECKFGNGPGKKVDVKVALYIHSRFRDLRKAWQKDEQQAGKHFQGWIVTNTTFSGDAITYGECAGLKLIGWDYPKRGNLRDWIEYSNLYPITSLTSLTKAEKQKLLKKGIVLAKSIHENPALLDPIQIPNRKRNTILKEINSLQRESF